MTKTSEAVTETYVKVTESADMVRTTHIPCTKTHEKVTESSEVVRTTPVSRTET